MTQAHPTYLVQVLLAERELHHLAVLVLLGRRLSVHQHLHYQRRVLQGQVLRTNNSYCQKTATKHSITRPRDELGRRNHEGTYVFSEQSAEILDIVVGQVKLVFGIDLRDESLVCLWYFSR